MFFACAVHIASFTANWDSCGSENFTSSAITSDDKTVREYPSCCSGRGSALAVVSQSFSACFEVSKCSWDLLHSQRA